jgi:hypothetical protein
MPARIVLRRLGMVVTPLAIGLAAFGIAREYRFLTMNPSAYNIPTPGCMPK